MTPLRSLVPVIVPTMNEADNIAPLVRRILDIEEVGEILFVDDSPNVLTVNAIEAERRKIMARGVLLSSTHRCGAARQGGLASAVVLGIERATYPLVIVMDGDLQHPPETIPALASRLSSGSDIVVASRYVEEGSSSGLSNPLRRLVSSGSTKVAKVLFPSELRNVTDPLTGFFGLHTGRVNLNRLRPNGFKILLEILVTHGHLVHSEVPLQFADRQHGESKTDFAVGHQYLRQLIALRFSPLKASA